MDLKDYVRLGIEQEDSEIIPFAGILRDPLVVPITVTDTSRQGRDSYAKFEMIVPDEWTKNFRGIDGLRDSYVAVRIPREFFEKYKKESEREKV